MLRYFISSLSVIMKKSCGLFLIAAVMLCTFTISTPASENEGFPVRIVSQPKPSLEDLERERQTTARQQADLTAQQTVASATVSLSMWSKWQFMLSLLGTAGIAISIILAREQIKSAKHALETTERAYVVAGGIRYISHPSPTGLFWRMRPSWINRGATPTRKVRVSVGYELRDDDLPGDFDFVGSLPPRIATVNLHQDGGSIEANPIDYYASDLLLIATGKRRLFVFGQCDYEDVFGRSHTTRFCVTAINITGDVSMPYTPANNVEIPWAVLDRFNSDD